MQTRGVREEQLAAAELERQTAALTEKDREIERLRTELEKLKEVAPIAPGPQSRAIALEKPQAWEYRLLFVAWIEEVDNRADLLRDYEAAVALGSWEHIAAAKAVGWIRTRLDELGGLVRTVDTLLNVEVERAVGPPGQQDDLDRVLWTSRKLGQALEAAVDWTQRLRRASVEEPFADIVSEMADFSADMIQRLCQSPRQWLQQLTEALVTATPEKPAQLKFELTLQLGSVEPFEAALRQAEAFYRRRGLRSSDVA